MQDECKRYYFFSSMTSVDLMIAETVSPFFSFISLGAAFGYHALDQIVSRLDDHVGHNSTELEFNDLSFETIARRQSHNAKNTSRFFMRLPISIAEACGDRMPRMSGTRNPDVDRRAKNPSDKWI